MTLNNKLGKRWREQRRVLFVANSLPTCCCVVHTHQFKIADTSWPEFGVFRAGASAHMKLALLAFPYSYTVHPKLLKHLLCRLFSTQQCSLVVSGYLQTAGSTDTSQHQWIQRTKALTISWQISEKLEMVEWTGV